MILVFSSTLLSCVQNCLSRSPSMLSPQVIRETRKVMRSLGVPVSNAFGRGSHGHQRMRAFRQNKDEALDKEIWHWHEHPPLWVRTLTQASSNCPSHEPRVDQSQLLLRIFCCRARSRSLVSGAELPPPKMHRSPPAGSQDFAQMWKTVKHTRDT